MVHRDIKPHNIFISAAGELVLGDFGLIFFDDDQHTRISATFQNVGSRDWMPGWAMTMKVEEVKPTIDVFSLGKVLWSMLSGTPVLPLWYWKRPRFNLEQLFPQVRYVGLANQLLAKCVVEEEEHCLPTASDLLADVDSALLVIERDGQLLGDGIKRYCRVCGVGEYLPQRDAGNWLYHTPTGQQVLKIFTCNHCGHLQTFLFPDEDLLPAWNVGSKVTVVGKWGWPEGEIVEFKADRTGVASKGPTFTWECLDKGNRQYQAIWSTGAIDSMTLSADGSTLSIRNNAGQTWSATRLPVEN